MQEGILVTPIIFIVGLLLLAAISSIGLRRIRFPYTIGLVVLGVIVAALGNYFDLPQPIHLTPDIIYYILLPTLIFSAAINIDVPLLWQNLAPVLLLAAPGLILSTVIVGGMVGVLTPLSFGAALLFGALISATDPVAVIALFEGLGTPKRLTMLVDGESLFNDATAIVLFNIIFAAISSGAWGAMTLVYAAGDFAVVFVGGILVGAAIGLINVPLMNLAKNDPLIEIAFSTVLAYTTFIVANYYLDVSGVMAVVGAGMVVSYRARKSLTPEVRQYLRNYWEYATFLANSFIFLLLGTTEFGLVPDLLHYQGIIAPVIYAIIAVTVARAVVVYGLIPILNKIERREPIDLRYQTVMFWGGLRGGVPLALVLSLPAGFAHGQLIFDLTLGVVLFTIVIQGTTISSLIHFFKLAKNGNTGNT
jgi:CPA1 family monovalent cation:H+ antiporter